MEDCNGYSKIPTGSNEALLEGAFSEGGFQNVKTNKVMDRVIISSNNKIPPLNPCVDLLPYNVCVG